MKRAVLALIKITAAEECVSDSDDFMVDDYAGGNIDDAFHLGVACGRIDFARDVLQVIEAEGE